MRAAPILSPCHMPGMQTAPTLWHFSIRFTINYQCHYYTAPMSPGRLASPVQNIKMLISLRDENLLVSLCSFVCKCRFPVKAVLPAGMARKRLHKQPLFKKPCISHIRAL